MERTIAGIIYNWRQYNSSGYSDQEFDSHTVGSEDVVSIHEHPAVGEGDRWFYDVNFKNGSMIRIFNPNQVFYKA